MVSDEIPHEFYTGRVVNDRKLDPVLAKQVLGSQKILVFSDDDPRDAVEQRRSRAHDARAKRADQCEFGPVATASGVA